MTDDALHALNKRQIKRLLAENQLLRLALRQCTQSPDPETARIARDALRTGEHRALGEAR